MNNVLSDFLTVEPSGLYCKYGDFYIDPTHATHQAVISHAHGDHAVAGHKLVWSTPATAAIVKYRHSRDQNTRYEQVNYCKRFQISSVWLQFLPAGHILGSAQVLMEYRGVTYLYTGDYKLQTDDTCEPLVPVLADVLITESTFAHPESLHPDPIAEICKFNDKLFNIILGTYALGKAQRLNSLIQHHCPDKTVLLHPSILPLHKIYEQFGIRHLRYQPYDVRLMKQPEGHYIYLVPPVTFNHYRRVKNALRAFASGWPQLHVPNDISIHISDHADWSDILNYVREVKPKEIWTFHGKGEFLQEHFAGKIPVKILTRKI